MNLNFLKTQVILDCLILSLNIAFKNTSTWHIARFNARGVRIMLQVRVSCTFLILKYKSGIV